MDPLTIARHIVNEQINPLLASHGGKIVVESLENGILYITMHGGCQGCAMAKATMQSFIKRHLQGKLPCLYDVIDRTNHAVGTKPYFKAD